MSYAFACHNPAVSAGMLLLRLSLTLMNEFLCPFRHVRALSLGPLSVKTDRGLFVCCFCFLLQHVVYPSHNKDFPLKVQAA